MQNRRVLITGATGIMGSWVLGEALARGYEPIALMRDTDKLLARERIDAVLRLVGQERHASRVEIIRGNACDQHLGLSVSEAAELRSSLDGMIHCAACTSFNSKQDDEIMTTNVGGVNNVLQFLADTGVPLYHVSTAYVAGTRQGRVRESELDVDQEFNNTYERSKCTSEKLVHAAFAEGSIQGAVLRPSIIVGATGQGRLCQFSNFYLFLRFIDFAMKNLRNGPDRLRLMANPLATKNLVPVDWTAQALWNIVESEGPSSKVYHLTNPNPITMQILREWANGHMCNGTMKVDFVDKLGDDATRMERFAHGSFRHYLPYVMDEPIFDRTNTERAIGASTPFPEMGLDLLNALVGFARERDWQSIFDYKPAAA